MDQHQAFALFGATPLQRVRGAIRVASGKATSIKTDVIREGDAPDPKPPSTLGARTSTVTDANDERDHPDVEGLGVAGGAETVLVPIVAGGRAFVERLSVPVARHDRHLDDCC
ncbi:MAG: hypothetical protein OXT09_36230 [Myxococcales bacterium]|nr:hypothetical protein [Myxococcales bacterium]